MIMPLYIWAGSRQMNINAHSAAALVRSDRPSLLLPAEGEGEAQGLRCSWVLKPGNCLLLPRGEALQLHSVSGRPLMLHLIEFEPIALPELLSTSVSPPSTQPPSVSEAGASSARVPTPGVPPLSLDQPALLQPAPYARCRELAERLSSPIDASDAVQCYGQHAAFQELIYRMMQAARLPTGGRAQHAMQAVELTVQSIHETLPLAFTLEQLAGKAGLSVRHYSRLFRQLTGQSPIDYMIGQRIKQAAHLLEEPGMSVQAAAGKVGFSDSFQFSRSFKAHTGISPRLYMKIRKQRTRVVSMQFLGEILTLGIKPIGAPSQLLDCGYFRGHVENIAEIGESVVTPYLHKLAELKPDVIITFNGHHYAEYARIAPTLDIAWTMPFFDRFALIADMAGRTQAARAWSEQYQRRLHETREQLRSRISASQSVSFFWLRGLPSTFQVYYDMGVLYRDMGLRAPAAVEAMQRESGHPFKADIPLHEMPLYAGDHMFVVVSPDTESKAQFRALTASPLWQGLDAVRRGCVYPLNLDWLREDPISMMGQLQDLAHIVAGRRMP